MFFLKIMFRKLLNGNIVFFVVKLKFVGFKECLLLFFYFWKLLDMELCVYIFY